MESSRATGVARPVTAVLHLHAGIALAGLGMEGAPRVRMALPQQSAELVGFLRRLVVSELHAAPARIIVTMCAIWRALCGVRCKRR